MAGTAYPTTGKLAAMKWSNITEFKNREENFFRANGLTEVVKEGDFDPLKATRAPITEVNDLAKGDKGDKVRFPYLGHLTQTPKYGNTTMEGSEEGLTQGDLDVPVDQVRAAAEYIGRVSTIRNRNLRVGTVNTLLSEFNVEWLEKDLFYTFYHGGSTHLISLSVVTQSAHPNEYFSVGKAAPVNMGDEDRMSTKTLDFVIRRWQGNTSTQTMRYAKAGKIKRGIIAILSPQQVASLCNDPKFWDLHQDALQRARESDKDMHPCFANADWLYRRVYIYESSRVYNGSQVAAALASEGLDETHHGAMFLGSDAMRCAHGGVPTDGVMIEPGMSYDSQGNVKFMINPSFQSDYGNKVKRSSAMIYGYVRTVFTIRDPADETTSTGTFCNSSMLVWTKEVPDNF